MFSDTIEFDVQYPTSAGAAYRLINRALDDYKRDRRGPTVLVVQSSAPLSELISEMAEFPIIPMVAQSKDNQYPALDWHRFALRRSLTNYLNCNEYLHEQLNLARFAQIPVGNIEGDSKILVCDVQMSRLLKARNAVLWYSNSDKPDLGGKEQDDNKYEKHLYYESLTVPPHPPTPHPPQRRGPEQL